MLRFNSSKPDISTLVTIGHFYFGLTIRSTRLDEADHFSHTQRAGITSLRYPFRFQWPSLQLTLNRDWKRRKSALERRQTCRNMSSNEMYRGQESGPRLRFVRPWRGRWK